MQYCIQQTSNNKQFDELMSISKMMLLICRSFIHSWWWWCGCILLLFFFHLFFINFHHHHHRYRYYHHNHNHHHQWLIIMYKFKYFNSVSVFFCNFINYSIEKSKKKIIETDVFVCNNLRLCQRKRFQSFLVVICFVAIYLGEFFFFPTWKAIQQTMSLDGYRTMKNGHHQQ